MAESYSIPETPQGERYVCHPCTPKCLRATASVIFYVISTFTGLPKGVSHKVDIDVLICPSGATDNTNYRQSQGDGSGPLGPGKKPLPPPVPPHETDSGTWGVSRIDRSQADEKKQYYPLDKFP